MEGRGLYKFQSGKIYSGGFKNGRIIYLFSLDMFEGEGTMSVPGGK